MHETFYRDKLDLIENFKSPLKGELTIVISKKYNKTEETLDFNLEKEVKKYLKKYSLKDVVELISKKEKISKKKVYDACLELKKNEKLF